jgi:hypothetical protein
MFLIFPTQISSCPSPPPLSPRFCEILIYSILFSSILFYSINAHARAGRDPGEGAAEVLQLLAQGRQGTPQLLQDQRNKFIEDNAKIFASLK